MDYEALSNSFWFTLAAYVCALLPWTVLASTDFMSDTWKSVRSTRIAGYRDLFWTFSPMGFVIFYSVVQYKAAEYSEMCAAAIAAILAALLGLRTLWGLWQLHEFRAWAKSSIDALHMLGIEYRLHEVGRQLNSTQLSHEILVNEKIVDNQIMHGDVHCYLQLGDVKLLAGGEEPFAWARPLVIVAKCVAFFSAVVIEFVWRMMGYGKNKKLRQVPKKAVDVWVHWATVFAAQGLAKWISEFEVAVEPKPKRETRDKTSIDVLYERGDYFGAEVLASAAMLLWEEDSNTNGVSPMLWGSWEKDSAMSDGRVVKQELFRDAITKGECLPFGASHIEQMPITFDERVGYDAHREALKQFISEIPVQSPFATEIEHFNIKMLEWLTVLLHIGTMCLNQSEIGRGLLGCRSEKEDMSVSVIAAESEIEKISVIRNEVAVANLYSQVSVTKRSDPRVSANVSRSWTSSNNQMPVSSIPFLKNVILQTSDQNRLVSKVGQMVDVWASLVSGHQIKFLVEELNSEWDEVCLGREGKEELAPRTCNVHENWNIRKAHKEMEKRRLERRIADAGHQYELLDQMVTFMGYRMESVRTVMGRWVEAKEGRCGTDLMQMVTKEVMKNTTVEVELSKSICTFIERIREDGTFCNQGAHCRLLWELQNDLEQRLMCEGSRTGENEGEKMAAMTAILFILSFPGLKVTIHEAGNAPEVEHNENGCCIRLCRGGILGRLQADLERNRTGVDVGQEEKIPLNVDVDVMCGPQNIAVRGTIDGSGKCHLSLSSAENEESFKWVWWREAFIGRLEGNCEWQKEMGLAKVSSEYSDVAEDNGVMVQLRTATHGTIRTWREWIPFRIGFCRFELESMGFLQQPLVVDRRSPRVVDDKTSASMEFGALPVQRMKSVCYSDAAENVLAYCTLLVRDAVANWNQKKKMERDDVEEELREEKEGDDLVKISEQCEESQAAILCEIAAVQYGSIDGLSKSMEILCRDYRNERNVAKAINLLQSFVGTMLSTRSAHVSVEEGREAEMESVILPECERVVKTFLFNAFAAIDLFRVLLTCLAMNVERYERWVMKLIQQMSLLSVDDNCNNVTLLSMAFAVSCIEGRPRLDEFGCTPSSVGNTFVVRSDSTENQRTRKAVLEKIVNAVTSKGSEKRLGDIVQNKVANGIEVDAMCYLGFLLHDGAEGVAVNSEGAMHWYERAIKEGNDVYAMYNLATLLNEGAEGVPMDCARAMHLYERAIEEGNHVGAMNNLSNLLRDGAEGVPVDCARAMHLYNRAIEEGNDVEAMYNLANLLNEGAEGVPVDYSRAMHLYNRAVEEGNHVEAMNNLGSLLKDGAEGVPVDCARALHLYERAIEEGNQVESMFNLASLLSEGAQGVPVDYSRAILLYNRAIEEGNHAGAMCNLANLLTEGAEGVPVDCARAIHLYERAIEEGNDACAMNNLGCLLEFGAEGVPADASRAVKLYERACEIGSDSAAMSNLGRLLTTGALGVPVEATRGVELLHGALEVGSDSDTLDAMLFLSAIYAKGLNEVQKDVTKSKELLQTAMKCNEGLNDAVNVLQELWKGFLDGSDDIEQDVELAAQLEEFAGRMGVRLQEG